MGRRKFENDSPAVKNYIYLNYLSKNEYMIFLTIKKQNKVSLKDKDISSSKIKGPVILYNVVSEILAKISITALPFIIRYYN